MKTLLYCPMLYHHDKGMWPPVVSSTSYFQWQKKLWGVFRRLAEWNVLWNAGQPNSNLYDPVREWRAENVEYASMGIKKALGRCDRVFVDVPSTVVWDAKRAGKPCLCVILGRDQEGRYVREDVLRDEGVLVYCLNSSHCEMVDFETMVVGWLNGTCGRQNPRRLRESEFIENDTDWLKEVVR